MEFTGKVALVHWRAASAAAVRSTSPGAALRTCPEIIESTFERVKIWVYNRVIIPYVVVVIDVEPIRERFPQ
jgi:hypothetical protein